MRQTGLVRAGTTEEGPAVDHQRTAAHRLEIGGSESPGGATADEDRVIDALTAAGQIDDRFPGDQVILDHLRPVREGD